MSDSPFPPPSGRQVELADGASRAVVTEIGGGIRTFEVDGVPVLLGYEADEMCRAGRGQVLAPWPNRLEDGRYEAAGATVQASIDEPEHHNAIHGLVRYERWEIRAVSASTASLSLALAAQPGYPWQIELAVEYEVAGQGLLVRARAQNVGAGSAPFGIGFHPYLSAGPGGADACRLHAVAGRRLVADERGLPRSEAAVPGTAYDASAPDGLALDGLVLDDCFTGLSVPAVVGPTRGNTAWAAQLERADGSGARVWAGPSFPYAMVFTADTLDPPDRRMGVAVEPMSCPANAFRTGEGLVTLEPGGEWRGEWGIAAI